MDFPSLRSGLFIAAAFVLMQVVGLDRAPIVLCDEAVLHDPAKELIFHGKFRSSVYAGHLDYESAYLRQLPGQPLVTAIVYKIFGFGIWQTRMPGVLFGAAAVFAVYLLALQVFHDPRAASFAAILFGLDRSFTLTARMGRHDTQALFLALLGVAFYLRADAIQDRRQLWLAFSGLLIGLAIFVHPIAVVWALAVGLMILFLHNGSRFSSFILFGMFASVPLALWLGYALSTPEVFQAQFLANAKGYLASAGVFSRIVQHLVWVWRAEERVPLLLVTYAAGLLWVMIAARYSRGAKLRLAVLFSVPWLFNSLFVGRPRVDFLHPLAIAAVAAGAMVSAFLPTRAKLWRRGILRVALVSMVFLNALIAGIFTHYMALAFQWRERDYRQVEAAIMGTIPKGSVVWGRHEVWYATVKAGVSLRLFGSPDPRLHDYAIVKPHDAMRLPAGFQRVGQFGQPLPKLFGMFLLSHEDYRMEIWQANRSSVNEASFGLNTAKRLPPLVAGC